MGDVRSFLDEYAAAFSNYDEDRLVDSFHVPCMMVNSNSAAVLRDLKSVRSNVQSLLLYHRSERVVSAHIAELHVESLGRSLAIARVSWSVRRTDLPSWHFWNTYNLIHTDPSWRVLVSTTHSERSG